MDDKNLEKISTVSGSNLWNLQCVERSTRRARSELLFSYNDLRVLRENTPSESATDPKQLLTPRTARYFLFFLFAKTIFLNNNYDARAYVIRLLQRRKRNITRLSMGSVREILIKKPETHKNRITILGGILIVYVFLLNVNQKFFNIHIEANASILHYDL